MAWKFSRSFPIGPGRLQKLKMSRRSGVVFASPLKAPSPLEPAKYNPIILPRKPLLRTSATGHHHTTTNAFHPADALESPDWDCPDWDDANEPFSVCGVLTDAFHAIDFNEPIAT